MGALLIFLTRRLEEGRAALIRVLQHTIGYMVALRKRGYGEHALDQLEGRMDTGKSDPST
jgi:hypothetical protein